MITSNSFIDIVYSDPVRRSLDYMHPMKYSFYLDKQSFLSNKDIGQDEMSKTLDLFKENTIFYSAILLKDKTGFNPLDYALEKNSPKLVEMLMKCMI